MKENGNGLSGKVALVTGGARGLGAATCRALAERGVEVVIADLREELAERTAREIRDEGGRAAPLRLDVRDEEQVGRAVDEVISTRGRLDVLINNAAVDLTVPLEELSTEDWDGIISVNLRAPFLLSKRVFPEMKRRGGGHIINIASTAAKRSWANASAYHASKWGLVGFSHALHVEGRPHGVKVTAVICGGMRTPFLLDRFPDIDLQSLQDPRNVAEAIAFVLSQPGETVIPELMVLPMRETSWP